MTCHLGRSVWVDQRSYHSCNMIGGNLKLVCLMVAISTLYSCVMSEKCSKMASKLADKGMMGGWSNGDAEALKKDITPLLDSALANSNDNENIKVLKDGNGHTKILKVYSQIVNGINYCVTFLAEDNNCDANSATCQKTCDAKVWQQGFLLQGAPIAELLELEC